MFYLLVWTQLVMFSQNFCDHILKNGEGIKSIIFLDDGICGGDSFEYTCEIAKIVIKLGDLCFDRK